MKKEFNLGWGESVAVRQAFTSIIVQNRMPAPTFNIKALDTLGYPKHEGDPDLVELTRNIIERQIGKTYKHILITNGATGGVIIALRMFYMKGYKQCWAPSPPYFRLYPDMISSAGLLQVSDFQGRVCTPGGYVYLVDSPSNPLGVFSTIKRDLRGTPIVWDHTYFNRIYCPGNHPKPDHDILVGSYGKLTGLNGLRVGWIATNDDLMYDRMRTLVTAEYCGISAASTKVILETAGKFDENMWESFEAESNWNLNCNRSEWSQLEKYFGGKPVTPYGMFYYAPIDRHCRKLLNKSNIIWSPGSHLGTTDDFGRFNVGQDTKLVRQAVKEILKNDKIK